MSNTLLNRIHWHGQRRFLEASVQVRVRTKAILFSNKIAHCIITRAGKNRFLPNFALLNRITDIEKPIKDIKILENTSVIMISEANKNCHINNEIQKKKLLQSRIRKSYLRVFSYEKNPNRFNRFLSKFSTADFQPFSQNFHPISASPDHHPEYIVRNIYSWLIWHTLHGCLSNKGEFEINWSSII